VKPTVKKVMVIGWDGVPGQRAIEWARAGKLPALQSMIERGIHAAHCICPHPTITPPNWTTIATGAWLGTHGITCFNTYNPGDPLLDVHQAFDAREVQAEYLWDAAARAGKKSIVLNWPTSWPSQPKGGIVIGGYGTSLNEWRHGVSESEREFLADIANEQLFALEEYPQASTIELRRATGWKNAPAAKDLMEAELPLQYHDARFPVKTKVTWQMLAVDPTGEGFTEVILSETKDVDKAFARLKPGKWTPKLVRDFETSRGVVRAEYRIKLEALTPDLSDLRIYVTPLCNPNGDAYPEGIIGEIKSEHGLPFPEGGYLAAGRGWVSPETFLDISEMVNVWLVDATRHLVTSKPWDLFFIHYHTPDWIYHAYARMIDPSLNDQDSEYYQEIELRGYQSVDRALGRTLELADENTLVILVSDHGCKPTTNDFHPAKVLVEAGLTVFKDTKPGEPVQTFTPGFGQFGGSGAKGILDRTMAVLVGQGSGEVDWSKTRAIMQRSSYVYVNLKGRDPQGIVEPGKEYEKVCDEIIKALYDYTDPATGKKPVVFALRKEDARMIGLWGDRVGDVIFGISGWFGRQHGAIVPTARYGVGDMETLFVMAGLGVKKGHRLERNMWLTDVVPTICHLAELPVPRECEGAVLYQALVNPDGKNDELKMLRQKVQRPPSGRIVC